MNIQAEYKKTEDVLDTYRNLLDTCTEERFTETPPGGGWSYAEVYSHIMQATLASTIALERCTQTSCKPTTKGLNWIGRFVFLLGVFPPVKIKVPAKVEAKMPALKISKEEARNLIIKCRHRLDAMAILINNPESNGRVKHPRLGELTAAQWLKFIRIHLAHHIKQLKRIENKF